MRRLVPSSLILGLFAFAAACGALHHKAPCEVDGVTYLHGMPVPSGDCNVCSCDDGEVACTLIACETPVACGGRAGNTCSSDEFCGYHDADCGFADGESVCKARPEVCPEIFSPVCGCDGNTYPNECQANSAGSGTLHQGACDSEPPASCEVGGITYPDGAGGIPASDGCNFCTCRAGQLLCTLRACAPAGKVCGGEVGGTCANDEYCAYTGDYCGAADATAVCQKRPDVCTDIYAPVCGCDNVTYSSSCAAAAAGQGYLHEGACGSDR